MAKTSTFLHSPVHKPTGNPSLGDSLHVSALSPIGARESPSPATYRRRAASIGVPIYGNSP